MKSLVNFTNYSEKRKMDKNFVLIIEYESGESAFLTNTPDLQKALAEYTTQLKEKWGKTNFKNCDLPDIKKAHIVRVWK